MKKIKLSAFLILLSIIISGCNSKTVICEGNLFQDNMNYYIRIIGDFNKDSLIEQKIELRIDLTNYLQYASIDVLYSKFKEAYLKFNQHNGVVVDVEQDGNSVIIKMEVNLEIIDNDIYKQLDIEKGEISYKEFINEFTKVGIACK